MHIFTDIFIWNAGEDGVLLTVCCDGALAFTHVVARSMVSFS